MDRNRIKRLTREAWRLQKNDFYTYLRKHPAGLHLFFVFNGREIPAYELVSERFSVILDRLKKELGNLYPGSGDKTADPPGHNAMDQ